MYGEEVQDTDVRPGARLVEDGDDRSFTRFGTSET
jgi:hypothetical protein